jgi:cytochrome c-type biogenesis protein CcmH/NrfG
LGAAAEHLARALESDPANPEVHALGGLLHDVAGELDLALACNRAALFLDPHVFQVRVLLAQALRRTGRAQRAVGEFRQVLATLSAGRDRQLAILDRLDQPDPESARRICLEALRTQ